VASEKNGIFLSAYASAPQIAIFREAEFSAAFCPAVLVVHVATSAGLKIPPTHASRIPE
jgi:hypothetical protein